MNAIFNTNVDFKPYIPRKKSSTRLDDSYRIFHITRKQEEESDDDDDDGKNTNGHRHMHIINEDEHKTSKPQRKSVKGSDRHGFDGWKRKSTKNKRLLFLHKTSCESTSNEAKTPPSPIQITNDISPSIISNDAASIQLLKKDKKQTNEQQRHDGQSFESDGLSEPIDETLNNLLARADQLETTVKQQDFNKIQRVSRINIQRKRCLIICSTILIAITITIAIIIIVIIMMLKHRTYNDRVVKPSLIYDTFR
ncbi:hypothetical protein I4U23_010205 [Adineta vaga]|nr:hypothetical protein I4U23_010205 [Adineta vaga]